LDLYRGQYDFQNFSTQVHDFDPGIHPYPGGLFWTVPNASVDSVDLGMGTGHMQMDNVGVTDFSSIPNALFRFAPGVDAACSFDIKWTGPVTNRGGVTTPGSTGELVMTSATMSWSATNATGFKFVSDPSPTKSAFAQLGKISNGVFAE
jgi:hypothetical protein